MRIFEGANLGELSVEPAVIDLVINLRIGKALGLLKPPSLRRRTDQIVE